MSGSFDFASVIVTTYNRPDALRRVLLGLDEQTVDAFEVVVADDGSSSETQQIVDELRSRTSYTLKYSWQEDLGFRTGRSRNLGVLESGGDYLIFLDGDCIPFADFVEGHRWLSEPGWFVRGTRVLLKQEFTDRVLAEDLSVTRWPSWRWVVAKLRGDSGRVPVLRIRIQAFRKRNPRRLLGCMSCNVGMWRADFLRVNGFDENYTGWGHEDNDLFVRFFSANVCRKEGRFLVPVVHLWHPPQSRSGYAANTELLAQRQASGSVWAREGISSHVAGSSGLGPR